MKVSKEIYELSEKILETFEPARLKAKELEKLMRQEELKSKKDAFNYEKWDLLDQQLELEDKKLETEKKDFTQETMLKEMMGCSRDHSKEIDIYSKTYSEKMERVQLMKEQGNEAYKQEDFGKASYYYAQALLIFYYLIPENQEEEVKSNELKRLCHMNQSMTFMKLKRFKEALQETEQALKLKPDCTKTLLRKAQIFLDETEFDEAKKVAKQVLEIDNNEQRAIQLLGSIKEAKKNYIEKSKELYQKMVANTQNEVDNTSVNNEPNNVNAEELKDIDKDIQETINNQEVKSVSPKQADTQDNQPLNQQPIENFEIISQVNTLQKETHDLKSEISQPLQQLNITLDFHIDITKRLKSLESKVEDLQLGLELIKQYGFNPKEYNEFIEILKQNKWKEDEQKLQQNSQNNQNKKSQNVGKENDEKVRPMIIQQFGMNPVEKLQLALIMIFISAFTSMIVYHTMAQIK
eukprot:403342060